MNRDRPWIDRVVAIFMNWPMKIGGCADEALDALFAEMTNLSRDVATHLSETALAEDHARVRAWHQIDEFPEWHLIHRHLSGFWS